MWDVGKTTAGRPGDFWSERALNSVYLARQMPPAVRRRYKDAVLARPYTYHCPAGA